MERCSKYCMAGLLLSRALELPSLLLSAVLPLLFQSPDMMSDKPGGEKASQEVTVYMRATVTSVVKLIKKKYYCQLKKIVRSKVLGVSF